MKDAYPAATRRGTGGTRDRPSIWLSGHLKSAQQVQGTTQHTRKVRDQAVPVNKAKRLPIEVVVAFCSEHNVDGVPVWRFACVRGGTEAQAPQESEAVAQGTHSLSSSSYGFLTLAGHFLTRPPHAPSSDLCCRSERSVWWPSMRKKAGESSFLSNTG